MTAALVVASLILASLVGMWRSAPVLLFGMHHLRHCPRHRAACPRDHRLMERAR